MKMNCGHSADLTLAKGPRRDLIRLNGVCSEKCLDIWIEDHKEGEDDDV